MNKYNVVTIFQLRRSQYCKENSVTQHFYKEMNQLYLLGVYVLTLLEINAQNFDKSITTTTGSNAPKGPFYSGELIFDENFDRLDSTLWQHEVQFSPVSKLIN